MTTKEEKARLINIAGLLKEIAEENTAGVLKELAEELLLICGEDEVEKQKKFIAAKVEKEKPEPKGGDVKGPMKIGDLNIGDEGIVIEAEILEIETNAGTTKAGKPYKNTKLTLSDKTGPIKLVLWNEQTEQADGLEINDVIRVEAWKVEKGYKGGVFELVYGQFGTIEQIKHGIERHII